MKGILVWGFFICFLFFILMLPVYGKLKEKDNSVRTAWINMDRQYQYRNDMILNLVDMVGSELPQEKDVLQTALAVHDRLEKRIEDKRNYFNYSVRNIDYMYKLASWLGCKKRSCFDDDIETLTE